MFVYWLSDNKSRELGPARNDKCSSPTNLFLICSHMNCNDAGQCSHLYLCRALLALAYMECYCMCRDCSHN